MKPKVSATTTFTVRVPTSLLRAAKSVCDAHDLRLSQVMRRALVALVEEDQRKGSR